MKIELFKMSPYTNYEPGGKTDFKEDKLGISSKFNVPELSIKST